MMHDTNFDDWYRNHCCSGSPASPLRALNLARRIHRDDFSKDIDPDEVETFAIEALIYCFERFDPRKGHQDAPIETRFLTFFRLRFKHKLRDATWDRRRRSRTKSLIHYQQWRSGIDPAPAREEAFQGWMWIIYGEALKRLDREVNEFVKLRHVEGLSMKETARRMGVSRSKLRRYARTRLTDLFRDTIAGMIRGQPPDVLTMIISAMYFDDHLDEDDIAALLLVPVKEVVEVLKKGARRMIEGSGRDAAMCLLADPPAGESRVPA